MYFYKDGKKILESDFVSGNVSKGYTTPPGLFSLTYKQRDATLKGQGYASPVSSGCHLTAVSVSMMPAGEIPLAALFTKRMAPMAV